MLKHEGLPTDHHPGVHALLRDVDSLLEHISFGFERLEFLQNTALGLVNIDQNKVIKIFTVSTVIVMPPTLIASIYGMNFRHMPEVQHPLGYPLAILLMLISSVATLVLFRRKGWLLGERWAQAAHPPAPTPPQPTQDARPLRASIRHRPTPARWDGTLVRWPR